MGQKIGGRGTFLPAINMECDCYICRYVKAGDQGSFWRPPGKIKGTEEPTPARLEARRKN